MNDGQKQRDDDHRALGEYMTEFSQLVLTLRLGVIRPLQSSGFPATALWAITAGNGARQLSDSFFAVARLRTEHDETLNRISKLLQRRIEREITRRNAYAHGDWFVGVKQPDGTAEALLIRVQARGAVLTEVAVNLQAGIQEVKDLNDMAFSYGFVTIEKASRNLLRIRLENDVITRV